MKNAKWIGVVLTMLCVLLVATGCDLERAADVQAMVFDRLTQAEELLGQVRDALSELRY